ACEGDTTPIDEICDGVDRDCDGTVDEGSGGPCYTGPAGTEGVGACSAGVQACVGGELGACEDQILPTGELCNGLDDDCDGSIDEGIAPQGCYTGPAGTEGVGQCLAGIQACLGGSFEGNPCEGEVTPEAEVCDGADRDCDGFVDIGGDPAAPGPARAVCGELVANHCRLWLAWTDAQNQLDPGADMGRSFTEWADCPDDGEDQVGQARCTQSGYDGIFHTLELPRFGQVVRDDRLGIRWQCQGAGVAPPEYLAQLVEIESRCRVTLGERYDTVGEPVAPAWAPCDADQMALYGVDGRSRCTSTLRNIVQGPRWRALSFGRIFGEGTDLGIALRCDADSAEAPYQSSIEQQAELWLGWAARFDPGQPVVPSPEDGISPHPWNVCDGDAAFEDEQVRCGPSDCRGWFRKVPIGVDLRDANSYDPGLLGVALRARAIDELTAPDSACRAEAQ
ncbi:MAG: hypothetical protein KC583_05115, partial [Myxococcales bacterium]|nr:hypothetical protein [Myxococcales bacterium]